MDFLFQNWMANAALCWPFVQGRGTVCRFQTLGRDYISFPEFESYAEATNWFFDNHQNLREKINFALTDHQVDFIKDDKCSLVFGKTETLDELRTVELDNVRTFAKYFAITRHPVLKQWWIDALDSFPEYLDPKDWGDTPIILMTCIPNLVVDPYLQTLLQIKMRRIVREYQPAHSNNHRLYQALSLFALEDYSCGISALAEAMKAVTRDGRLPLEDARGDKAEGYRRMWWDAGRILLLILSRIQNVHRPVEHIEKLRSVGMKVVQPNDPFMFSAIPTNRPYICLT